MSEIFNQQCANLINALGDVRLQNIRACGPNFDLELVYHMGRYMILVGNDDIMMYGIYPEVEGEGFCLVEEYGENAVTDLLVELVHEVTNQLSKLKKEREKEASDLGMIIETLGSKVFNVFIVGDGVVSTKEIQNG